jgi:hypothetical protein
MKTKKKKEKNVGQEHLLFHREEQRTKELPFDEASPATTSEARD